jgi:GGDEF domain-containing protein
MGLDAQSVMLAELRRENELLRRECARYRALSPYDAATGLLMREHFELRLHHEWARAERFWNALSLIAFDATPLAQHPSALRELGRLLGASCRDVDVAGWAGAGFAVILPSTNRTGAEAELARLLAADARLATLGTGLAVGFDDANTAAELLLIAGRAASRVQAARDEAITLHTGICTWLDSSRVWDSEPATIPCP